MPALTTVSDTLYIPLLGRIYTTKHYPDILRDDAALAIYDTLEPRIKAMPGQTEYASLASAVRSMNMDRILCSFLSRHPDGAIVNLGCGLETLYQRNDNGEALWFELDLPEVLALRSQYFPESKRDRYLPYSMFDPQWMDIVKKAQRQPVLFIASGLFLYFPEDQIIGFIRLLAEFSQAEVVFDTLSPAGLRVARRMIDKMGKQEAPTYFCVKKADAFAAKISDAIQVTEEIRLYSLVQTDREMSFDTRFRIAFSDMFNMVKLIRMKYIR
ncbi:MAG TPA: class I SAM-dependent methyltransferase [Candidatus Limiplasma sp.]|nr:class I SAM-dependent methyltransferase [Candidatus Limiplasma sp.]